MKRLIGIMMILSVVYSARADLQTDMMNDKIERLDREMTLLQKKVYEADKVSRRRGGSADGQSGAVSADGLSELYGQLDAQNNVVSDLTRRVEELSFAVVELKEQIRKMNADIDMRFQTLPAPVTIVPGAPAVPQKKPDIRKIENEDKAAYDAAYDLLKKGKYAEAEKAFAAFIQDYPESTLAGNANYWLGETYYVRGQYDVAAGIFSDGLTQYEKNSKAPDNLLKLGMTMAQLKKKNEACGFLTLLPEKFPKASDTLKKRAESEARKLACPK